MHFSPSAVWRREPQGRNRAANFNECPRAWRRRRWPLADQTARGESVRGESLELRPAGGVRATVHSSAPWSTSWPPAGLLKKNSLRCTTTGDEGFRIGHLARPRGGLPATVPHCGAARLADLAAPRSMPAPGDLARPPAGQWPRRVHGTNRPAEVLKQPHAVSQRAYREHLARLRLPIGSDGSSGLRAKRMPLFVTCVARRLVLRVLQSRASTKSNGGAVVGGLGLDPAQVPFVPEPSAARLLLGSWLVLLR